MLAVRQAILNNERQNIEKIACGATSNFNIGSIKYFTMLAVRQAILTPVLLFISLCLRCDKQF